MKKLNSKKKLLKRIKSILTFLLWRV